ncbi:MAG: hypothetical protein HYZ72_04195 [Deltaproteobacteria bacterium]|nr:hypothetical protein [Deltaproteobacteria bacterium]
MDSANILITINILAGVLGFLILGVILSRDLREISHIQRALFLMLRRQYGDMERELQELSDLVKAK